MDINARINWMPGMEITAQTFLGVAENWDFRQRLALQTAMGSNRMGRIPGVPFECKGVFVENCLEVEYLRCAALLPSGRIVDAEDNVQLPIPMLIGDKYYLTVSFSDDCKDFEKEGVAYVRPRYDYALHTKDEIEDGDFFPLMRLTVSDGSIAIEPAYIPPCLQLGDEPRFKGYIDRYIDRLSDLTSHQNMAEGDGKRSLLHYLFTLKGYSLRHAMQHFLLLLQEIAHAVDYFVFTPHIEHPPVVPACSEVDVQEWLEWFDGYLAGAAKLLDTVVLPEPIDFDALLARAKKELYDQLSPELTQHLMEVLSSGLHQEMQQLKDELTTYIKDTLKAELLRELNDSMGERMDKFTATMDQRFDDLSASLHDTLHDRLYSELYDALYNALYVPSSDEKDFVPLI